MLCCVCVRQMYRLERVAFSFLLETFAFQLKNHKIALASMKRLIYIKPQEKPMQNDVSIKWSEMKHGKTDADITTFVCCKHTHYKGKK